MVTRYSLKRRNGRPPARGTRHVVLVRVFACLSAVALVAAFAIAALLPPQMSLGSMLLALDPTMLGRLHLSIARHAWEGLWRQGLMPFLLRPAWLTPLMTGLVAAGIAYSLNNRPTRQSTRRSG
ncbi:hypothetical protein [Lichenicoccus roseus]|uniref:Uncharacterized protein n=1 Tax=Lichenicoccus roseus TaxID=2683649 RepID=A0A5R9J0U2_9PROT|nr:hypothetical protein [Lichenicoccus roseus]TLU71295.1 hypothetical protein FE263_17515 [Lichenicoccus roseus]